MKNTTHINVYNIEELKNLAEKATSRNISISLFTLMYYWVNIRLFGAITVKLTHSYLKGSLSISKTPSKVNVLSYMYVDEFMDTGIDMIQASRQSRYMLCKFKYVIDAELRLRHRAHISF